MSLLKKLLYCTLVVCVLSSCLSQEQKKKRECVHFLKVLTTEKLTGQEDVPFDKPWTASVIGEEGLVTVFLLNSNCSVCIKEFLDFLDVAAKVPEISNIIAVLNENDEEMVKHYMSLGGYNEPFKDGLRLYPVKESYPYMENDYNNLVMISGDKILSERLFIGFEIMNIGKGVKVLPPEE